jgi:CheY-specific phosphatase CheX
MTEKESNDKVTLSAAEALNIDLKFIKTFIDTTRETLKTVCEMETTILKPFLKGKEKVEPADIAGVIGVNSTPFTGTIALCFPEKTFLPVISNMLREECREINADVEDGASELLNIIFGRTKLTLNKNGYDLEKAIPSVVRGEALKKLISKKSRALILPVLAEELPFYFEVEFQQKNTQS